MIKLYRIYLSLLPSLTSFTAAEYSLFLHVDGPGVCPSESGHTQKVGQLLCSHSRLLAASHRLSDLAPETLGLFTSFKAVCPQNCSDCYFWKWYLVWSFFCQIITVRDTQTGGHFHKASGVKQQQQPSPVLFCTAVYSVLLVLQGISCPNHAH